MQIISDDIKYVGVNDHKVDLFEGHYDVPNGMAYNSYVILDDKIAVMDSVGYDFGEEWLANIRKVLGDREPDYFIVQHLEPDHSKNITRFMDTFKSTKVLASSKAFTFMDQLYHNQYEDRRIVVKEGDTLPLGKHTLHFITAQMVHWPEVIMTYDDADKVLFAADGFGRFGANDVPFDDWAEEARRYYIGIVGKYGMQVQKVLKKAAGLDIQKICSLHGPVLTENLGYYLDLYDKWSSYTPEAEGICICYTSVYGNTKKAVELLADKLRAKGAQTVIVNDLARTDLDKCVGDAFRYSKIVLATTTYMNSIFPYMRHFLGNLAEREFQNRTVGFIENGTWAPCAAKHMKEALAKCKNLTILEPTVTIKSSLNEQSEAQLEALADALMK